MTRIDPKDAALLCGRLSRILKGNLSPLNALEIIETHVSGKPLRRVIHRMIREMKRGETFAESAYICEAFDPCFLACVRAAEEQNRLPECLTEYTAIFEEEIRRDRVLKGSVYFPAVVSFAVLFMLTLLVMFVYPHFIGMFNNLDLEMPALTKSFLSLSGFLQDYWEILVLSLIAVSVLVHLAKNSAFGRRSISRLFMESGIFGHIRRRILYSRFARLLWVMKKQEIADQEALNALAESFDRDIFFSGLLLQAAEQCNENVRLSRVLQESEAFPEAFTELLSLGEELGDVNGYLDDNALFYLEDAERIAQRRLSVWEPVLILLLAFVLILLMTALTTPMITLFDEVSHI
ncbi:MAG: type II secretion system F family protein [Lachnospiraceae bacterium]|nr:type II secretion system F family protein [Lachnospiraceae bacterium]